MQELKKRTYGRKDYMTVAEAPGVKGEQLREYIGEEGHFSMIFDFSYTDIDLYPGELWLKKRTWTMKEFKQNLFGNQHAIEAAGGWAANYLENHDQPRSINKYFPKEDIPQYRDDMAKVLGALFFFLRGTPFIYQGEELGMTNTLFGSISEVDDVNTKGQYARCLEEGYGIDETMESINRRSRDHARLPMQWDTKENFGFSKAKPWIACNNQCNDISVETESGKPDSVLQFYKDMIRLRNHSEYADILMYGMLSELEKADGNLIGYKRMLDKKEVCVVVNMGKEEQKLAVLQKDPVILLGSRQREKNDSCMHAYEVVVWTTK